MRNPSLLTAQGLLKRIAQQGPCWTEAVTGTDVDAGLTDKLKYSIEDVLPLAMCRLFWLTKILGLFLSVTKHLNYERQSTYTLIYRATDNDPRLHSTLSRVY